MQESSDDAASADEAETSGNEAVVGNNSLHLGQVWGSAMGLLKGHEKPGQRDKGVSDADGSVAANRDTLSSEFPAEGAIVSVQPPAGNGSVAVAVGMATASTTTRPESDTDADNRGPHLYTAAASSAMSLEAVRAATNGAAAAQAAPKAPPSAPKRAGGLKQRSSGAVPGQRLSVTMDSTAKVPWQMRVVRRHRDASSKHSLHLVDLAVRALPLW